MSIRWFKRTDRITLAIVLLLAGLTFLYPHLARFVNHQFFRPSFQRANGRAFRPEQVRIISPRISERAEKKVHLNAATASELKGLEGIGPVLAERIVEYRRRNGEFESVDQLVNVQGIGAQSLEEFSSQVTVNRE